MNELAPLDAYGVLTEPATLKIQRVLPGPVERVWDYLVKSELRRQWLAAGDMPMAVGVPFELVWRNDELTDPPGQRPACSSDEHRLESHITELDPPRALSITWGNTGGVSFTLEARGDKVLLTLVHHRLCDRATLLNVSAGWHAHLDILVARMTGGEPGAFWDGWTLLKAEYDQRLPA